MSFINILNQIKTVCTSLLWHKYYEYNDSTNNIKIYIYNKYVLKFWNNNKVKITFTTYFVALT